MNDVMVVSVRKMCGRLRPVAFYGSYEDVVIHLFQIWSYLNTSIFQNVLLLEVDMFRPFWLRVHSGHLLS